MRELEKLKKKTLSRRAKHRMFSLATIPALMISLDYSLAAQAADQVQAADQEQTRQQSQPDSQPPSAWNALTGLGGLKDNLTLGGFVRTWASMNLQNHPEVANGGAGELQMLRSSLELDAGLKTGPFKWTAIGRLDREILTPYEKSLQDMVRQNTPGGRAAACCSSMTRTSCANSMSTRTSAIVCI
ncbi:hypothetical protein ACFQI9_17320 [Paraburkholderia dipogonis]|uniref:hypothetical protein n=1 Tax=Paraburkholderia dipogonis TaxID=1211383 RepID=UPI001FCB1666|nr:hypothetical protein [Paraburkholderia dipogonis]